MGQEARCACHWNGTTAEVKAVLEPPELILRGGVRRHIPLAEMKQVRADGDHLLFSFEGQSIALELGSALSAKWAKALLKPPASLAKKLGITPETTVHTIGSVDAAGLKEALAESRAVSHSEGDLIVARVDTPAELAATLKKIAAPLSRGVPIWLIYRKGPGHALNESIVRSTALSAGIVDTKVAAVSDELTGLRFVARKSSSRIAARKVLSSHPHPTAQECHGARENADGDHGRNQTKSVS